MVSYVVYGRGSFNQLDEILQAQRKDGRPMIFFLDHFFEGKPLADRIPLRGKDKIIYVDVTHEPKTSYVDELTSQLKEEFGTISGVIGIGGGSATGRRPPCQATSACPVPPDSSSSYGRVPITEGGVPTSDETGAAAWVIWPKVTCERHSTSVPTMVTGTSSVM